MSRKGISGHWSKYDGGKQSARKKEITSETWVCQSCAKTIPKALTPYLFEWSPDDWVRVCASCFNQSCKPLYSRRKQIE